MKRLMMAAAAVFALMAPAAAQDFKPAVIYDTRRQVRQIVQRGGL